MELDAILKLKEILSPEDDIDDSIVQNNNKGSVLNPGSFAGAKKQEEMAKPFAKVEAKVNNRLAPDVGGSSKSKKPENDIWKEDEIKEIPISQNDPRQRPEIDVRFKQKVGTEDVFLGMSDMDPSSTKCQDLMVTISLPDTRFKEISLDVTQQAILVQSPRFYLHHILPYKVNEKEGKAQWISDKYQLKISLPIIRDDPF